MVMSREQWAPTARDLKWCGDLVNSLNDGATWVCSAGIYQIDKQKKTLTLTLGIPNETSEWLHERNKIAFPKVGYQVLELPDAKEKKPEEKGEVQDESSRPKTPPSSCSPETQE